MFFINDGLHGPLCCFCNKAASRISSETFAGVACKRCRTGVQRSSQEASTSGVSGVQNASHIGAIMTFKNDKGFGFILDKETRSQIFFHKSKVKSTVNGDQAFAVGAECLFDISIKQSGRKPESPQAVNIRTLNDTPFRSRGALADPIMI